MSEKPELEVLEETDVKTSKEHQIILYNDDINTFDHVISCLINICRKERIFFSRYELTTIAFFH